MSFFGKNAEPHEANGGATVSGKHYGIEETIRLMRGLPIGQNLELVISVVKSTLESMNVHLAGIIAEAARKQQTLEQRIGGLKSEIAEFEKEIAKRQQDIEGLEHDLAETSTVKERLELAEAGGRPPPAPTSGVPAQAPSRPQRLPPPPMPSNRPRVALPASSDENAEEAKVVVADGSEDERETMHQLK